MNKSTKKIFEKLNKRTVQPYIFYIPFDLLPEEQKSNFRNNPPLLKSTNTFITIDKKFNIKEGGSSTGEIDITQKQSFLNNQIITLLELKANNDKEVFNFIIEKYAKTVESLYSISYWLLEHFDLTFKSENDKKKKKLFEIQLDCFEIHFLELKNRFNQLQSNKQTPKKFNPFLNQEFQNLIGNPTNQILNSISKKLISEPQEQQEVSTPLKRPKRDKHINAQQARDYLLDHVFGINSQEILSQNNKF
ncbi:MAG: hypothetical protein BM564_03780 [Bacteroidetes bacterium MedPE-SWsnd-G2]|nr:MAG: hypothetical protein BM564_03780 [Bacteroidetes bacterium MedPE-SWsnd-G2]